MNYFRCSFGANLFCNVVWHFDNGLTNFSARTNVLGVDIYMFQVALSGDQSENHMISEAEKNWFFREEIGAIRSLLSNSLRNLMRHFQIISIHFFNRNVIWLFFSHYLVAHINFATMYAHSFVSVQPLCNPKKKLKNNPWKMQKCRFILWILWLSTQFIYWIIENPLSFTGYIRRQ